MSESNRPIIRAETDDDIDAVRAVNEAAFPTLLEANLVDALRAEAEGCISIVAEVKTTIVGHLMLSPMTMNDVPALHVMALAPMAVSPTHQRRGLGSALVRSAIERARRVGVDVIIVLGHPAFYPRFGFDPASEWGVRCPYPARDEAFMLLELRRGAIATASPDMSSRTVSYHEAFDRVDGSAPNIWSNVPADELPGEVPCVECGYTLRKPEPQGKCPECGRTVAESIAAAQRWPAQRRRTLRRMVRATELALATQWLAMSAITFAIVEDVLGVPRHFVWPERLFNVAVPVHLLFCWAAGECALAAFATAPKTSTELQPRPPQRRDHGRNELRKPWWLLARFLPISAILMLLVAFATIERVDSGAVFTAALVLIVMARAATLATAYDALRVGSKDVSLGPIRNAIAAARWLAGVDGVVLVMAILVTWNALISFSNTPLFPAMLIAAAIVATVSLICGTVATITMGRTLRREWRHLKR